MGKNNIEKSAKMITPNYSEIAALYNHLMKKIDYEGWSDYIFDIYSELNINSSLTLELASGTCQIATYLNDRVGQIILSDISSEMLKHHIGNMTGICFNMSMIAPS